MAIWPVSISDFRLERMRGQSPEMAAMKLDFGAYRERR